MPTFDFQGQTIHFQLRGSGQLLLLIHGFCEDQRIWDDWAQQVIPIGLTIGHEYMGHVVETGSLVKAFKEGDRVTSEGHIACGRCRNCRRQPFAAHPGW